MIRWLMLLMVVVMGTACSLPESKIPPVKIYTIQVPEIKTNSNELPVHLVIRVNYTSPVLDTNKIMVMPDANRYEHISNVSWPAALPGYVRDLMIRTFHDNNAVRSVSTTPISGAINYNLSLQIYNFEAVYQPGKKGPNVHISLGGTVSRLDTQEPRTEMSFHFKKVQEATDNNMQEIIKAFESAFQQVASEVQTTVVKDINAK